MCCGSSLSPKASILCCRWTANQARRWALRQLPIPCKEAERESFEAVRPWLAQSWITLEEAVLHYAADDVRWTLGASVALFRGGHNAATGLQSCIEVHSIIGTRGVPGSARMI